MGWGINTYNLVRIPVVKPCGGYYLRWYYNGFHYWFFLPGKYSIVTEGEKYYTIGTRKIMMGSGQITRGQAQAIRTIMMTREVSLLTVYGWVSIRIEPGTLQVYDNQLQSVEIEFKAVIGSKEVTFSPLTYIPVIPPSVAYCEIVIGSQIWMCYNWDINYPGSKVYDDDESNRAVYGGLYTYAQVMSPGFVPTGWHVPTLVEWNTLIAYVGANPGGILKEVDTIHWFAPNASTDLYGFKQLPTGYYNASIFGYSLMGYQANLWTSSAFGADGYCVQFIYNASTYNYYISSSPNYFGVRLIKDGTFTLSNGMLYNASAALGNIAPAGWHVPTKTDFNNLDAYLGVTFTGGKLKEVGSIHWAPPNTGATNSNGYTSLASGDRNDVSGAFEGMTNWTAFWSKTVFDATQTYTMEIITNPNPLVSDPVQIDYYPNKYGFSIRLIKDDSIDTRTMTDIDGNSYSTVKIGTQVWMRSNLKVTRFNDGTPIPEVTGAGAWTVLVTPGRCWYNNVPS